MSKSANTTLFSVKNKLSGFMSYFIKYALFSYAVSNIALVEMVKSKQYVTDDITNDTFCDFMATYVFSNRSMRIILHGELMW